MPNYQSEIEKLRQEVEGLKKQLTFEQLQKDNYKQSLDRSRSQSNGSPLSKDVNPIIKQIRSKNMSLREKSNLLFPDLYPSAPEDIYYQWVAPSRLTIKRDRQWYWTVALVIMLIVVFGVLVDSWMIVAVALSFFFAVYINASLPASDTVYRLTKQGMELGEGDAIEIYSWGQLLEYAYYFKNDTEVIYIYTILPSPQRITILFPQEDRKNINMILEANLPYKPAPKRVSAFSRFIDGIYIPINEFKSLQEKIDRFYDLKYAEILNELKKTGKIRNDLTVNEVRNAEKIRQMKLMDDLQKQQEEEAKRMLGLS